MNKLSFPMRPALVETLRRYNKKMLAADVLAGVIVGIVALPLAIAFGIASGVSPEKGILTAIVAGLIVSLLGGSRVQIGGPTGAFIGIVYGIIEQYGFQGLMVSTFMAGIFLVLFSVLRLGVIIKFIPYPIVVGFTSGIAVTIFSTQVNDLLGLGIESVPSDFVAKWAAYFSHLADIHPATLLVSLASVALIAGWPALSRRKTLNRLCPWMQRLPGSLIAIVLVSLVVTALTALHWTEGVDTIGDRFTITASLPAVSLPRLSWDTVQQLAAPALTIAVLGAIESLLSATVADGVIATRHDSNSELLAQGVANMVTPLFGGIPATGAIARTMTNINNGGRTPVAGVVHAFVLLAIFLFLMPLARYIPMACLAGVLMVVAWNMYGWRSFVGVMRMPKSDVLVLWVTFLLTIFFDLVVAIEVGLVCACLLFMRRMAETTDVRAIFNEIDPSQDSTDFQMTNLEHLTIPEGVEVYEINGPYFFGAGNRFEEVMSRFGGRPMVRIIRMRKVPFVDSTGIHNLQNLCQMSCNDGIKVVLSGVQPRVDEALRRAGFVTLLGAENICSHIHLALQRASQLLEEERRKA